VAQIEETFGVDASAPAGGMMMAGPAAAVEEAGPTTKCSQKLQPRHVIDTPLQPSRQMASNEFACKQYLPCPLRARVDTY
jgi:hypothetical protein